MRTSERRAVAAFRGLLEATSVPDAMTHVAAIASASAGADLAAVFLRADGEARLRLVAGEGCPAGLVGTVELALGDGAPAARCLERRAAVLSTEIETLGASSTDLLLEALISWVGYAGCEASPDSFTLLRIELNIRKYRLPSSVMSLAERHRS